MVVWPEMCCGCGFHEPHLLRLEEYDWSRMNMATSTVNHYEQTDYLKVRLFLCPQCYAQGRTKFIIAFLFFFTLMMVGLAITFGALTDEIELWALALACPGIGGFVYTLALKRHFSAYFANSGYYNGRFRPKFKSPEYQNIFYQLNPGTLQPTGRINKTIIRY
jgi:hypothetical protein